MKNYLILIILPIIKNTFCHLVIFYALCGKYLIYPFLNEMPVGADGAKQTYPQIYGLKGSLKAHRNYFIQRRYDLKQVEYGYVSTLGAQFYQSTASLDKAYTLKPMQYRLTIPYRVQLSTSNGVQADSGVVDADVLHSLQLTRAFGENDPLKIIGAAKVKELVWHEDAFAIGFNFGLLTSLVKLDMSVEKASGYRNGSFMASTNGMLLLEEVNMRNNRLARNGDNGNVATLDLSWQGRLKKLDVRGTGLTRVKLFPRDADVVAEAIGQRLSEATGKRIEAMVYGDGAFKDPVGKIWELADPVVSPGYTAGLEGTPNELKLKYLADHDFGDLSGEALQQAVAQKIREKDASVSLVGNMVSEGTTPRHLTDLIGSLCDLTSGSGDKGTPVIYIQGYFDNYTNE